MNTEEMMKVLLDMKKECEVMQERLRQAIKAVELRVEN